MCRWLQAAAEGNCEKEIQKYLKLVLTPFYTEENQKHVTGFRSDVDEFLTAVWDRYYNSELH